MTRTYINQGSLFPLYDSGDQNYEFKRAKKQAKREREGRVKDLVIKFPYRFTEKAFIVSRNTSGEYYCQAHSGRDCHHIQAIKFLLRLRKEAGYTGISEKDFLKQALPVADVR
jgi:hypothetical protein